MDVRSFKNLFENDFARRVAQKEVQAANALTDVVVESIHGFVRSYFSDSCHSYNKHNRLADRISCTFVVYWLCFCNAFFHAAH